MVLFLGSVSVTAQVQFQIEPHYSTEFDPYEDEEEEDHASDDVDPDDKKKPRRARRKWWQRRGNFVGNSLNRLIGRMQPKYLHLPWFSSHKAAPKYEYETVVIGKKIVLVEKSDSKDIQFPPDPTGSRIGNPFYKKGDPKTPTFPFGPPYQGFLFAVPDTPTAPKSGKFIDSTTTTTVTGNLTFSFGDEGDTKSVGGKGRIRITAVDPAGTSKIVYDSGWTTTLGKETTVALPKTLPGN